MFRALRPRLSWWLARVAAILLITGALAAWQFLHHDHRRREDAAALRIDDMLGATVEQLDDDIAADLGLPIGSRGLVLTSLAKGGPSARAGLRPGDVIEEVGQSPIDDPLAAEDALHIARRAPIRLLVNRHGQTREVRLDGPAPNAQRDPTEWKREDRR